MAGETETTNTSESAEGKSESSNTETSGTETTTTEKPVKTFTQEEVENLIGKRLAKFKDFDTIKDKAEKYEKLEDANKSETERLQAELDRIKNEANEKATKYANVLRRAAIVSAATKAGIIDPDLVFEVLAARGFPDIDISDDESVSGVEAAIGNLVKERPYLKGSRFDPNVNGGPQGSNSDQNGDMPIGEFMRRNTDKNSVLNRYLPDLS